MSLFGSRRQSENEPAARPEQTQPAPVPLVQQPVGFETVLGANSTMEGTLRSGANVRLDGTFTGTLEITGNVLVGETAKINADINAKNISVAGAVRGNVTGKKVQLLRTGRVWGDISATALTTEEGAFIDGKISMVSHEAARSATSQESDMTPEPVAPEVIEELEVMAEEAEAQALAAEDSLEEENGELPLEDDKEKTD